MAIVSSFLSIAATPAPEATAGEFLASLQAPVALEDLAVDVADNELEISFGLRQVGHVSVAVYAEGDGSGRSLVTVGGAVVAEVGFVNGAVAWEESDFSELSPAQAQALTASLMQVWHAHAVTAALPNARDLKCTWAGKIAGATIGVAVFAGCGVVTKSPGCYGHGIGAGYGVARYITDKCNGAQNK